MIGSKLALLAALLSPGMAGAQPIDFAALAKDGRLLGGEVLPDGRLRIKNSGGPKLVPIVVLERPFEGQPAPRVYSIRGKLEAEGVEGTAYLETWNVLPGLGRFFSRTLGSVGPMAAIRGTQAPRAFELPFDPGQALAPDRIELNVAFEGAGTVTLGTVELGQASGFGGGGWIGGLFGTVAGLVGALVGFLASRGRARGVALAAMWSLVALSGGLLVAGLAGVGAELVLTGIIGLAVVTPLVFVVRRRYEAHELRRMQAMDV